MACLHREEKWVPRSKGYSEDGTKLMLIVGYVMLIPRFNCGIRLLFWEVFDPMFLSGHADRVNAMWVPGMPPGVGYVL